MKIYMTHDLSRAIEYLAGAGRRYGSSRDFVPARDLVVSAVGFTIQLAIEAGRDATEMRALERELIDALTHRDDGSRT